MIQIQTYEWNNSTFIFYEVTFYKNTVENWSVGKQGKVSMLNKVLPRVSFTNPMQNWRNMLEAKILVENFGIEIKQCQNYDQNQEAEYYSSNFDFNI